MSSRAASSPSRATTVLVVVLGFVGLLGAASSFGSLRRPNAAIEAIEQARDRPATASAGQLKHSITLVILRAPWRRALDGANLLASGLLFISAVLLMLRHKEAPFWVSNAAVANALWVVAEVAGALTAVTTDLPRLTALAETALVSGTSGPNPSGVDGAWLVFASMGGLLLSGAVRLVFYAWVFLRIRKPDVAAWLSAPRASE